MRLGYRELLIALFVIGALAGLLFGGGVVIGRGSAPPATQIAAVGGAGGGAGATATGAAGGQAGGTPNLLAGQTIGTVAGVQGDAITVRGQDSRRTIYSAGLSTRVTNSVAGTAGDVRAGQLVAIVPGPPDPQGRTIATSILILPAALAPSPAPTGSGTPAGQTGGARPSATASAGAGGNPAGGASATPARTPTVSGAP